MAIIKFNLKPLFIALATLLTSTSHAVSDVSRHAHTSSEGHIFSAKKSMPPVTLTACNGEKIYSSGATYSHFFAFLQAAKCEPNMMTSASIVLTTSWDRKLYTQVAKLVGGDVQHIQNPTVDNLQPATKEAITRTYIEFFKENNVDAPTLDALTANNKRDQGILSDALSIYASETGASFNANNYSAGSNQPHLIFFPTHYNALQLLSLPRYFPTASVRIDNSPSAIKDLLMLVLGHEMGHNKDCDNPSGIACENIAEAETFLMATHHPELFSSNRSVKALQATDIITTFLLGKTMRGDENLHRYFKMQNGAAWPLIDQWPTKSGILNTDQAIERSIRIAQDLVFGALLNNDTTCPSELDARTRCLRNKAAKNPREVALLAKTFVADGSLAEALKEDQEPTAIRDMVVELAREFPSAVDTLLGPAKTTSQKPPSNKL